MASFNKIVIVGYLGRDPEIRYLPDGTAVCNFTIATTERRKDRSGDSQDVTTWFRVNVWGKQAESANQYLSKGRQVYVEGRLTQQEYTDREGNRRTSLDVRATDVQFLGARGDDASHSPSSQPSRSSESGSAPPDDGGDEIPF
ncbi:MAG: single-stranded DNA-binding protein [Blastocatellales bacterium]